jgi:ABC-type transport system involved in multi-copper enzyme maturation permease subunit
MGKARPFLEVFASTLNEDYRFPIPEIFAFLYALGTFIFANLAGIGSLLLKSEEAIAFNLVYTQTGLPVFIFVILILKNIAYGLGGDFERGVIQTLLSYPLKRRMLLTAKLASSLGVALLIFLGIQVFALFVLSPDIIPYIGIVLMTYLAVLSYPLLVAGLVLILTLFLKRGSIALIIGIILYFASGVLTGLLRIVSMALNSDLPLKASAIIDPTVSLQQYYGTQTATVALWTPSFTEALLYIGAAYALVALVFTLGYLYFERKLEI